MRTKATLIRAAAVAALAIAMGTSALAAESLGPTTSDDQSGTSAADHATAHATLPSIAAGVIAALTGGSNPSTTVAQNASNENANATTNANTTKTDQDSNTTTTDQDTSDETETDTSDVSKGQEVGDTGTAGTKPGWGCGDTNHKHSGPPGRPGATEPPGCANARSHD